MSAYFDIELDTTPPELTLTDLNRTHNHLEVFYTLSEPGTAEAVLVTPEATYTLEDLGDRLVATVSDYAAGTLTVRGLDEVWNADEQSLALVAFAQRWEITAEGHWPGDTDARWPGDTDERWSGDTDDRWPGSDDDRWEQ